jgi:hypothetical protein
MLQPKSKVSSGPMPEGLGAQNRPQVSDRHRQSSVCDLPVRGLLAGFLLVSTESVVCRLGVQPQDLSLLMNPERKCGD